MINFMKVVTTVLIIAAVLIATSYMGAYFVTIHSDRLMSVKGPAYFTDTNQNKVTTLKAGTTVILHETVVRKPLDCFAMYVVTIKQPGLDSVQFPPKWSTIVSAETELQIATRLDLPADLLPGRYHLTQYAFPTCSSFTMPPFDTGVALDLDVVR